MDNGFDPCEYVWSQEMAMRRLLTLLRHSQAYCTDNECYSELPGSNIEASDGNLLFMMCWFFIAIILFFLRSVAFQRRDDTFKSGNHDGGTSGGSSAPASIY